MPKVSKASGTNKYCPSSSAQVRCLFPSAVLAVRPASAVEPTMWDMTRMSETVVSHNAGRDRVMVIPSGRFPSALHSPVWLARPR
ncbi:hypothetical protein BV898_03703 [Hypsibius exemplaris]|uniref:Uncharacterized protein n=1 Tax=Hypsibius exemplaris TaxID=2072580 RepID=A0A1W0X4U9_HYPEX|nr:hypothetical protein BV898_03703 [Hypsibius exemplaris]